MFRSIKVCILIFLLYNLVVVSRSSAAASFYCLHPSSGECKDLGIDEKKGTNKDPCPWGSTPIKQGSCPATNKASDSKIAGTVSGVEALLNEAAQSLNPASFSDPAELIGIIIGFLYFAVGAVTLVLYIYAGFLWMTAGGNTENIEKSKKVLFWTTAGVIALFASYLITKSVFEYLGK